MLLDQALSAEFGSDAVFRSSRSIPASANFESALRDAVAECSVMLVLIGRRWMTLDQEGVPRLFVAGDWVRTEIELALQAGKRVIPIVVGDRHLPSAEELPPSVMELARLQYRRFHYRSAEYDIMQIVDAVRVNLAVDLGGIEMPVPNASMRLAVLGPTQRSTDVQLGPADIDGRHYSDSVVYRCRDFASGPRGEISFNLSRRYRRFEATVGVLDDAVDAGQNGVFQVVIDGVTKKEVMAKQGSPCVLSVDVSNGLNLKLVAYRPGMTVSPLLAGARMAGGLSNNLPELAWGTPTVHP